MSARGSPPPAGPCPAHPVAGDSLGCCWLTGLPAHWLLLSLKWASGLCLVNLLIPAVTVPPSCWWCCTWPLKWVQRRKEVLGGRLRVYCVPELAGYSKWAQHARARRWPWRALLHPPHPIPRPLPAGSSHPQPPVCSFAGRTTRWEERAGVVYALHSSTGFPASLCSWHSSGAVCADRA